MSKPAARVAKRGKTAAGAECPRMPEIAPTLRIGARALYDRAAPTLKVRGHLRRRAERNDLAAVCGMLDMLAGHARENVGKSPTARRKGVRFWKRLMLTACVVTTRHGWISAGADSEELFGLFGLRRLLPRPPKGRRPHRPTGGDEAA